MRGKTVELATIAEKIALVITTGADVDILKPKNRHQRRRSLTELLGSYTILS